MPGETIESLELQQGKFQLAARAGDVAASKKVLEIGAKIRGLKDFASANKNADAYALHKKAEEDRVAVRDFKTREAKAGLAVVDEVENYLKEIDRVAAELGNLVVKTEEAGTKTHAHAQASLHSELRTGQFTDVLRNAIQQKLANVGVTISRYGKDPGAPNVATAGSPFVEGIRSELTAQLRALGEKP